MSEPDVRPARRSDLQPLGDAFGEYRFFAERYARQRKHQGVLFVAWLGGHLVGNVYLWLEEAEEEPIRKHLPGVALLTHLEVRPDRRDKGIGTSIVERLEQHLLELGRDRVALAVRTDNPDATRLYDRLGYRDWGSGLVICHAEVTQPNGLVALEEEKCHVMVKDLTAVAPSLAATAQVVGTLH
jgi:GNAT superfamily N-acetyltransferase